jgi:hypothetical protein
MPACCSNLQYLEIRTSHKPSVAPSLYSGAPMIGSMTWVLILSPMSVLPLRATISLKLAPGGMVTGGAKSSESPYFSEMYLVNSMNRTI